MVKGMISRRGALKLGAATAAIGLVPTKFAIGNTAKVKVGIMLPYSGTYALLGEQITNGFKLALSQAGDKLGGRDVEFVPLDDESDPSKAPENASRLVNGDKVDFLVGTVHSGVAMGILKVVRDSGTITIIPNAGVNAATGGLCAPNVFRTSFSNWQSCFPMGKVAYDRGYRNVVTMSWKYAAGEENLGGFEEGFTALGGKIVKRIMVPFPNVEFQAQLTEIASLKPDAVFAFYAGAGAVKFVKDYAAAGLNIQLLGPGHITDGVLKAQGAAAEGLLTTHHYCDGLDTPENKSFRAAYLQAFGREADAYAVQGYDTGTLLLQGMDAVKGDASARPALIAAMEGATINSPRGAFTLSKAHNPVQDMYLRQVQGGEEVILGVAHKALADPARGCKAV